MAIARYIVVEYGTTEDGQFDATPAPSTDEKPLMVSLSNQSGLSFDRTAYRIGRLRTSGFFWGGIFSDELRSGGGT